MRFSEIDGDVWTVPAARMKSGEPFRYPLPPASMQILQDRAHFAVDDFVFPSYRRGQCISENALLKALNAIGEAGRPHGFRTSFRTWAQDTETCSYDVAETVLAHKVGGKTERSYARSDMLDRRRIVMQRWADHATGEAAKVVVLRRG